tara:strand:+ start:305 stop:559 length:255 start_codon:yes stop_codon:yes gene_type:complete
MISTKLKQELLSLNSVSELNEVIAFARDAIAMNAKASINVGDEVFVVQKTKKTLGIVEKVNVKKALVKMPNGVYNVPLSMLEAA